MQYSLPDKAMYKVRCLETVITLSYGAWNNTIHEMIFNHSVMIILWVKFAFSDKHSFFIFNWFNNSITRRGIWYQNNTQCLARFSFAPCVFKKQIILSRNLSLIKIILQYKFVPHQTPTSGLSPTNGILKRGKRKFCRIQII